MSYVSRTFPYGYHHLNYCSSHILYTIIPQSVYRDSIIGYRMCSINRPYSVCIYNRLQNVFYYELQHTTMLFRLYHIIGIIAVDSAYSTVHVISIVL